MKAYRKIDKALLRRIIKRLLLVAAPLLALFVYAQIAFLQNGRKEHPTDAGLGIAIFLVFILVVLCAGFLVDVIVRLYRKQYDIAIVDASFLTVFLAVILCFISLF